MEEYVAIPIGAFADPSFPAPSVSVYEERMHGGVVPPAERRLRVVQPRPAFGGGGQVYGLERPLVT